MEAAPASRHRRGASNIHFQIRHEIVASSRAGSKLSPNDSVQNDARSFWVGFLFFDNLNFK